MTALDTAALRREVENALPSVAVDPRTLLALLDRLAAVEADRNDTELMHNMWTERVGFELADLRQQLAVTAARAEAAEQRAAGLEKLLRRLHEWDVMDTGDGEYWKHIIGQALAAPAGEGGG